jgi:hypothetical protein
MPAGREARPHLSPSGNPRESAVPYFIAKAAGTDGIGLLTGCLFQAGTAVAQYVEFGGGVRYAPAFSHMEQLVKASL